MPELCQNLQSSTIVTTLLSFPLHVFSQFLLNYNSYHSHSRLWCWPLEVPKDCHWALSINRLWVGFWIKKNGDKQWNISWNLSRRSNSHHSLKMGSFLKLQSYLTPFYGTRQLIFSYCSSESTKMPLQNLNLREIGVEKWCSYRHPTIFLSKSL